MRHENIDKCLRCDFIFNRYPRFNEELKNWFLAIRVEHPEAHISCAGRGMMDQENVYQMNLSRARWGHSAHNWNAAIDIFQLTADFAANYRKAWFDKVIFPNLYGALKWYGDAKATFHELPHVELSKWRELKEMGKLSLVENYPIIDN